MKKLITIVAVLLLVGVFVSAQDFGAIRGKVVDEDGTPLPGVNVKTKRKSYVHLKFQGIDGTWVESKRADIGP